MIRAREQLKTNLPNNNYEWIDFYLDIQNVTVIYLLFSSHNMFSLVITNIWQKVNDVWWNLFTLRYSCNTAIKVGVKHQLINQSITQTYQKQVLKVEQCIETKYNYIMTFI
jgi:hypothetical protein